MPKKVKSRYPHEPDYAVAPGETLAETIEVLGIDQRELAVRAELSEKTISQIINGHAPITAETALKLERVTGVPASMWNNLEATFRERRARIEDRKRLESALGWLKTIPVRELIKRGLVEPFKDQVVQLQSVLAFFGVDNPDAWTKHYGKMNPVFRKSGCFRAEPGAISTWFRIGELKAQEIQADPFNADRFKEALVEIRKLTMESLAVFEPKLKDLCRRAGVVLVFVKEMAGCPVSGAARWLTPVKPLIQMTFRYKADDHFWFTFFHEAGHLLHDSKKEVYIEDNHKDVQREEQANRFAANMLIPPPNASALRSLKSRTDVQRFARTIGIAPGIVVGRLQKQGLIPYSHMNDLKRRLQWGGIVDTKG